MVSLGDSTQTPRSSISSSVSQSSSKIQRSVGRSMRTVRSNLFQTDQISPCVSENLTESVIDFRLRELAKEHRSAKSASSEGAFLDLSQSFSDFSACSSDISGELQRLAAIPVSDENQIRKNSDLDSDLGLGLFQKRDTFSTEIFESVSVENLESSVKISVKNLESLSIDVKRSAAAKLRLLAKNRPENRAVIGDSGAIRALIPLLKCTDPSTQEHSVTALLNLSLYEPNKITITESGAIKPLVYVLKTGTSVSKQNSACALLSLSLIDDNKLSIGACGAIPPLVSLLIGGSSRGKKDALTTLYKLCSVRQNKERAVSAGVIRPLVELVGEQGNGMAEKAMVVLSSLAGIAEGRTEIVEEGGIPALVEAIEDGSSKGKEFAVLTLLLLCTDNVRNRGLLVREGGIPPLVGLSQSGAARAKHKAETLLRYLREQRQDGPSSSP
ncbi:ARM repeat superfamily protein [Tasmannia lanceolata]|uniref:ARM repeat superfamily protein n=1 Tax=Tasmannia lanceolata TaxID=3420 RepID=UPI0040646B90